MTLIISAYKSKLVEDFRNEQRRLSSILPTDVTIEHIGSSAVGIGGKNIVDILICAEHTDEMKVIGEILENNGYHLGKNHHSDRIFLATSDEETGEGDFHAHICLKNSETYNDMLLLRDFLRSDPETAKEYEALKYELAKKSGYNREKYKSLKSKYVKTLLEQAKKKLRR